MIFSEVNKATFQLIHWIIIAILLSIIGLFMFEEKVLSFDTYSEVYAIIPSEFAFEDGDQISFLLFAENEDDREIEVTVNQTLMCDYGIGNGFSSISTQESVMQLQPRAPTNTLNSNGIVDAIEYSNNAQTEKIRDIVRNANVTDNVVFAGAPPEETSQCFVKFRFTKYTPQFNIAKVYETSSYPFDYVLYYGSRSD